MLPRGDAACGRGELDRLRVGDATHVLMRLSRQSRGRAAQLP
jgi:hypothetical protein